MATTTKSKKTSVKSKTTKKPVSKKTVAAKSAPKKTTAKTAAVKKTATKRTTTNAKVTKPTAKAEAKPAKSKLTVSALRKWHLLSAGVFALFAAVAAYDMKSVTSDITLAHVTTDALASGSQAVLASAAQPLITFETRWYLVGILVLSAVISLLRATRLKAREEKGIAAKVLPTRWIDFGLTFGALTGFAALLAGVSDVMAIKLAALAIVVSYVFAWLSEAAAARGEASAKVLRVAGVVTGLVPWAFIIATLVATTVYGGVRYGWYVYAFAGTLLAAQLGLARIQKRAAGLNYLAVEQDYVVLNFLTKLALAAILIAGLRAL